MAERGAPGSASLRLVCENAARGAAKGNEQKLRRSIYTSRLQDTTLSAMKCFAMLLFASAALAQGMFPGPGMGPNPPLLELKQFLELTDAQYAQIFQNINQHRRTLLGYQQRIAELRRDIAVETAREHPSATELGTRYVEVEINCRLMKEEDDKLRARNQALLTAAQKTKFQALLDAIKLLPIVNQAQQAWLLESPNGFSGNLIPGSRVDPVMAGLLPVPQGSVCGAAPLTLIRPQSSTPEAH